jgi:putative PIN family toxin of toxin-antitoxin system
MDLRRIVIDTSVWIAALRSRRGASHRLLTLIGTGRFEIHISVPLVLEYEDVAKRMPGEIALDASDIDDLLDYICSVGKHQKVFYLWRPFLRDPGDDFVLELAVAAGCDTIVTLNQRHFAGVERFGIATLTPKEFLQAIGGFSEHD